MPAKDRSYERPRRFLSLSSLKAAGANHVIARFIGGGYGLFLLILDVIDFVSGNINYVDIELGVGGYVPHPCRFVLEKRYGDCKDMAFLAAAMLREKGIDAYPVLAKSRRHGRVYPEFAGNQFNHVILGVQLGDEENARE